MAALMALGLTALSAGLCIGALIVASMRRPRLRPESYDMDTILEQAEKPFYEKAA
jgi:hypothetical protein